MAPREDGPGGGANTFAGSKSMRVNYAQGVDVYYADTGSEYRNPHLPGIVAATDAVLREWWPHGTMPAWACMEGMQASCMEGASGSGTGEPAQAAGSSGASAPAPTAACDEGSPAESCANAPPSCSGRLRVLDLACGSGEATQAFLSWWCGGAGPGRRAPAPGDGVAAGGGPSGGGSGAHQQHSMGHLSSSSSVAADAHTHSEDADAGAGAPGGHERQGTGAAGRPDANTSAPAAPAATAAPEASARRLRLAVTATDPYTHAAYAKWVGVPAETHSFQDVADGVYHDRAFHLAICSYALHVLDDSRLFGTLLALSLVTSHLLVLSPHKKPAIGAHMGWTLVEAKVVERVHVRLYQSTNLQKGDELARMLRGGGERDDNDGHAAAAGGGEQEGGGGAERESSS